MALSKVCFFENQKNILYFSRKHNFGERWGRDSVIDNLVSLKNICFSFDFSKTHTFGDLSVGREGSGSPDNEILYLARTSPMKQLKLHLIRPVEKDLQPDSGETPPEGC